MVDVVRLQRKERGSGNGVHRGLQRHVRIVVPVGRSYTIHGEDP